MNWKLLSSQSYWWSTNSRRQWCSCKNLNSEHHQEDGTQTTHFLVIAKIKRERCWSTRASERLQKIMETSEICAVLETAKILNKTIKRVKTLLQNRHLLTQLKFAGKNMDIEKAFWQKWDQLKDWHIYDHNNQKDQRVKVRTLFHH